MTSVQVIRRSTAGKQIDYRLADACGQENATPEHAAVGYRLKPLRGQYPIERIGRGWEEFGHQAGSTLATEQDYEEVRRIMVGRDPHSDQQLIIPKKAVHPDALLPARPFVDIVHNAAQARGEEPSQLLSKPALRKRLARMERGLVRKGETHRVPVEALEQMAQDAGITLESVYRSQDLEHAREHAHERIEVGKAAHDLTVTRDRTNDVFRALASEEMALRSDELFMWSVRQGVNALEQWASYGMAGHHGDGQSAQRVESTGWAATITWHRTTRSIDGQIGDPHLHAHVLLPHMVYCPDEQQPGQGTWRTPAAGGYEFFRHCEAIDHYIQALYRRQMAREFGIRYTYNPYNREWQLVGVPQELVRHFSRRSAQIEKEVGKGASVQERQRAGRATAGAKIASTPQEEWQSWRDHALEGGWDPEQVIRDVLGYEPPGDGLGPAGIRPPHQPDPQEVAARVWDPEEGVVTSHKAAALPKVMAKVAESCPEGLDSLSELQWLTNTVVTDERAVQLPEKAAGAHMRHTQRYTSQAIVDTERHIAAQARARLNEGTAAVPEQITQAAIDAFALERGYRLSAEQEHIVHRLAGAGHGIEALIGQAGSGKSTVMDALRRAWHSAGLRVHGAATAAVAAGRLRAGSQIPSSTVASIQHEIASGRGLEGVDVLVLEEAAMMDDHALAEVMAEARRTGTKLVTIGDPQQLRAVGVGGGFKRVHELVEGLSLTENYRQSDAVERSALHVWRTGQRSATLGMWGATGHIMATEDLTEAYAQMVAAWWNDWSAYQHVHEGIEGSLLLAATNRDVDELNARARVLARQMGLLTGEDTSFALPWGQRLDVAVGDLVRVRANDYRDEEEDVLNGYRGHAVRVDGHRGVLVEWREGTKVHQSWVGPDHIARGGLSHGYALTIAAAQGLTSTTCQVLALGADAHALYPAMSRVRQRSTLWAPAAELEPEEVQEVMGPARSDAERLDRVIAAYGARLTDEDDQMITDELDGRGHQQRTGTNEASEPQPLTVAQARDGQGPTMVEAGPRLAELESALERSRARSEQLHQDLVGLNTQLHGRKWLTGPLQRRVEHTHQELDHARQEHREMLAERERVRREAIEADLVLARHSTQQRPREGEPRPDLSWARPAGAMPASTPATPGPRTSPAPRPRREGPGLGS